MRTTWIIPLLVLGLLARPATAGAQATDNRALKEELRRLREENERIRQRMEELERKVDQGETKHEQREQELEKEAAAAPRRYLERYFGENRFVLTGWGAGTYEWHRNEASNTFTATFVPIFLYRATDQILFEGEPELELSSDGDTEVNLEYAQADIFIHDYVTLVGGKFLLPFGDFIQQLHPAWINKLASNPLPFREGEEGGLLPFSDIGAQLRGGARLFASEGVDLDYTVFISNGPRFESDEVGAGFETNSVDPNKGKGYGARLAIYPLPLAMNLGRLKLGVSTFDGKWDESNDLWFTSWGIDTAYQFNELEMRGEYLQSHREMMGDEGDDNREGWYLQAAYKLARVPVPHLNRLEAIVRYSGVNQRAVTDEELVPHPRQVAIGLDYWFTPSVVGKVEYDRELPDDAENDHAIRAQVGVGF